MSSRDISTPRLAAEAEVDGLITLFCSGAKEIGLKPHVCSEEGRPELRRLLETKCAERLVWVINQDRPIAMLVLDADTVTNLSYVVVDPQCREMGLGPTLVRHIQSLRNFRYLRAEARNPHSKHMLEKCGFERDGEVSIHGYPYMVWQRPPRRRRPKPPAEPSHAPRRKRW
jgi:GNAT superfamily N-acetyltransferase